MLFPSRHFIFRLSGVDFGWGDRERSVILILKVVGMKMQVD